MNKGTPNKSKTPDRNERGNDKGNQQGNQGNQANQGNRSDWSGPEERRSENMKKGTGGPKK
jgi:hypothetical protein